MIMKNIKNEIFELKKQLELKQDELNREKAKYWNKKAEERVIVNKWKVYESTMSFGPSPEKIEYRGMFIAWIDKTKPSYDILYHLLYISNYSKKLEKNQRIYSSCPYITHGMKIWDTQKFIEKAKDLLSFI